MSEVKNWREREANQKFELVKQSEVEFPCIIPTCSNWYLDSIASILNGYVAYGGRSSVVILNMKVSPPVVEKQWLVCPNKKFKPDRVTSVALLDFCQNDSLTSDDAVAISSSAGLVRIYTIKDMKLWKEHNLHKVSISAIAWSKISHNLLVAGDEKGKISIWNFDGKAIEFWTPKEMEITCLQMSPKGKGIVAIGYKDGTIVTGNVCAKEKVIAIFKCHQNEVKSISWNQFDSKGDFASASKDQDVKVWKVGHKKALKSFEVTAPKGKRVQSFKKTAFTCTCWFKENTILIGQQNGTISSWNFESGKINTYKSGPRADIYSLLYDNLSNCLVCFSTNRSIILLNCDNFKMSSEIMANNGYIYSLSISPFDSNCITIGVADGIIKTWTFGNIDQAYAYSFNDLKKIKAKPFSVFYHPSKEGVYAYGTYTGQVGITNLLSNHHGVSSTQHSDKVYSICWGPHPENERCGETITCIYSVGDKGKMFVHDTNNFENAALDFTKFIKDRNDSFTAQPSELVWNNDYMLLAIGNKDGSTNIFSVHGFKSIIKIEVHKGSINCLRWHHDVEQTQGDICFSNLLASSSDDSSVCVTDITTCLQQYECTNMPQLITNPLRKFDGHKSRVYDITWNPHDEGILASASNDETVQIWNALNDEKIGNFREHHGRVQTVLWSLNDPDIIYSGGEDCALRRWKISELIHEVPPGENKLKKKKRNPESVESNSNVQFDLTKENVTDLIDEDVSSISTPNPTIIVNSRNQVKKKRKKSLFPKSSVNDAKQKELMQNDCILLARYLKAEKDDPGSGCDQVGIQPGSSEYPNLGMYATRKDALRLINMECEGHKENQHMDCMTQLNLWKFSLVDLINKAIEEKSLTEAIVALSNVGGDNLWRATVLAYAQQLEENNDINHAAMYYIALGNSRRAIQLFKENDMLKEAMLLAKAQLTSKDPLLIDLYTSWADKLMYELNFEKAAECYLAIGEVGNAVTALAKRGDSRSLTTAFQVAKIYEHEELERLYFSRCIEANIYDRKWDILRELISENQNSMIFELQLIIGEILDKKFFNTNLSSTLISKTDFSGDVAKETTFLQMVDLIRIKLHGDFTLTDEPLFQCMRKDRLLTSTPSVNDVFQHASNHLVVAIINLLLNKCNVAFQYLLKICELFHVTGYVDALEMFLLFIFPQLNSSFQHMVSNFNINCQTDAYMNCYSNFYAYYMLPLLYKTWWADGNTVNNEFLSRTEIIESDSFQSVFGLVTLASNMLLSPTHSRLNLIDRKIIDLETFLKKQEKKVRINNENPSISTSAENMETFIKETESIDDLTIELRTLSQEREQIPDYFKDFSHPKINSDTLLPVLYICSKYMQHESRFRDIYIQIVAYLSNIDSNISEDMRYLKKL